MKVSSFRYSWVLLALLFCVVSCSKTDRQVRKAAAQQAGGSVVIGFVWPKGQQSHDFYQGAYLAQKNINAEGGVLSRPLELMRLDDKNDLSKGAAIAQSLAKKPDVVAVIGHFDDYISSRVSRIYSDAGILMLTPGFETIQTNELKQPYVFHLRPLQKEQAKSLASYVHRHGAKRIAVLYMNSRSMRHMANELEHYLKPYAIDVSFRHTYERGQVSFHSDIQKLLLLHHLDMLVVLGGHQVIKHVVFAQQQLGLRLPIVSGWYLNRGLADRVLLPSSVHYLKLFDAHKSLEAHQSFLSQYQKKYHHKATLVAAMGYDSVQILASAMRRAQSTWQPLLSRSLLRIHYVGILGVYQFNAQGYLQGLHFKVAGVG